MVRYLSLLTMTQQGVTNIAKSPARAKDFRDLAEAAGGKVVAQYWTIGEYDGVLIFEAPDDAAATGLLVKLVQQGDVRSKSMRLHDEAELTSLLG